MRKSPPCAVMQKRHESAQPACEETQSVSRPDSGMSTDSILLPSASSVRNFLVESAASRTSTIVSGLMQYSSLSLSRSALDMSVISSIEAACLRNIHA